jgi:hypothetical protein
MRRASTRLDRPTGAVSDPRVRRFVGVAAVAALAGACNALTGANGLEADQANPGDGGRGDAAGDGSSNTTDGAVRNDGSPDTGDAGRDGSTTDGGACLPLDAPCKGGTACCASLICGELGICRKCGQQLDCCTANNQCCSGTCDLVAGICK